MELDNELDLDPDFGEEVSFDDAPLPQTKPSVSPAAAAKPSKEKSTKAKSEVKASSPVPKVSTKKQHRLDVIDRNKIAAFLDKLVNEDGYTLISVIGSSSIMGSYDILSVKEA